MTIFSIFRRPPPASILAFLQSDFACRSHGTGAILRRVFRQILGTFRGQKVHFSAILDHFFDFSRQFLLRFWVRNHKTTHQHMPNNFVFHHIPILGPKKSPPLVGLQCLISVLSSNRKPKPCVLLYCELNNLRNILNDLKL